MRYKITILANYIYIAIFIGFYLTTRNITFNRNFIILSTCTLLYN